MKKAFILVPGLILFFQVSHLLVGAIPAEERAALIALYNSTNGYNWTDNSGWKGNNNEVDGFSQVGSEGTWYGITVSENHVQYIFLDSNNLNGTIPVELGNLSGLEWLDFYNNNLTGNLPPALANLGKLTGLELRHNNLTGTIPSYLGNLSNLEWIALAGNQFYGSIPAELGNLKKLETLDLSANQLTGSIPTELGNLINLRQFKLVYNRLSGTIPSSFGNLRELKWLHLSNNQLSGSIPPSLGNLTNLITLNLSSNQLTGSIPPELGNISELVWLYLDKNRLSGGIPSTFGNFSNLYDLYLSSNQLSGSIPTGLLNLIRLLKADIGYNALYTNDESLRSFLNSKDADWEQTQTIAPTNLSAVAVSSSSIKVSWTPIIYTGDAGRYLVYYSTTSGGPWTRAGKTADKSAAFYEVTGLVEGFNYYFMLKTQTDPHGMNNNPVTSEESEKIPGATGNTGPFGSFDTPLHGSLVRSSIPVTGWALDNLGVANVRIYRGQDESLVYLGEAVFIGGARPDIEQAYPGYPNNNKAGWGYMMLTNFLPNGGNGTFEIHAIVTDIEGNSVTLGTKTITCDNANGIKPFGAIDAPTQGGTASGRNFINWGWALTPQPNHIPTDGSTINVWVDGVNIGHPTYNIYRSDIASLFPDYANSSGAVGYFYLDTTAYENGVHTIQWTAMDNAGNTDGIGSRYFTIVNTGDANISGMESNDNHLRQLQYLSVSHVNRATLSVDPVLVKKGYDRKARAVLLYPDHEGIITIQAREDQRIEILLKSGLMSDDSVFFGYMITGNRLQLLPIGSTLDNRRGIFYWHPCAGFLGLYRFVFGEKAANGQVTRKLLKVVISPK